MTNLILPLPALRPYAFSLLENVIRFDTNACNAFSRELRQQGLRLDNKSFYYSTEYKVWKIFTPYFVYMKKTGSFGVNYTCVPDRE